MWTKANVMRRWVMTTRSEMIWFIANALYSPRQATANGQAPPLIWTCRLSLSNSIRTVRIVQGHIWLMTLWKSTIGWLNSALLWMMRHSVNWWSTLINGFIMLHCSLSFWIRLVLNNLVSPVLSSWEITDHIQLEPLYETWSLSIL